MVEFAASGHNDSLAVFFLVLALLGLVAGEKAWALVALGLSTLSKLFTAFLWPVVLGRWMERGHDRDKGGAGGTVRSGQGVEDAEQAVVVAPLLREHTQPGQHLKQALAKGPVGHHTAQHRQQQLHTEEGAEQIDAEEGVGMSRAGVDYPLAAIRHLLARPNWFEDDKASDPLRGSLLRLCARYLIDERGPQGTTLDSVAHFHLRNGARLERLNWLADRSERGITHSAGIMINYVYELDKIDTFHEAYTGRGVVTTSSEVDNLLKA